MADLSFVMEQDVDADLDSGLCMEIEQSLAEQVSVGLELDWFLSGVSGYSLSNKDQKEANPGGHGETQTQEESEMEADSGSGENSAMLDDQTEESQDKKPKGALDVCLQPVKGSGFHVRIALEEVQRFYRLSCCCHWLCGRCQVLYCFCPCFSCHSEFVLTCVGSFFLYYCTASYILISFCLLFL